MAAKRTYPYRSNTYPAKRLKYLETAVKRNRPEMQFKTTHLNTAVGVISTGIPGFVTESLTPVAQGNGKTTRSGNKIRVWRVEVRGFLSPQLNLSLIQSHGPNTPVVGSFTGRYLMNDLTNTRFTEWKYYNNMNASDEANDYSPCRFVQKFSKGMIVKFPGSSIYPDDNGLHLCCNNFSADIGTVDVSIRVWFTDE